MLLDHKVISWPPAEQIRLVVIFCCPERKTVVWHCVSRSNLYYGRLPCCKMGGRKKMGWRIVRPTRVQYIHTPPSWGGSTLRSEHINTTHSPSRSWNINKEVAAALVFQYHKATYTWEGVNRTVLLLWWSDHSAWVEQRVSQRPRLSSWLSLRL